MEVVIAIETAICRLKRQHCQIVVLIALQVVIAAALPSCHCSSIAKLSLQQHCQVVIAVALPSCHCVFNLIIHISMRLNH